jgi:dihydrofolate reductase
MNAIDVKETLPSPPGPRVQYFTACTLDGFIADADNSLDWLFEVPHEGDDGSWDEFIGPVGSLVMGATTYEWILAHHIATGGAWDYRIPCWVFTHRQLEPVADTIRFTSAPVTEVHAAMVEAAGGGDLWMVGGGDLAAQFAEAGLLDELVLSIAPVTLGAGRPLFPRPFDLELTEVARNGAFLCARYAVVGPRN